MKQPKADQYPGFAPPRRPFRRLIRTAIILALGLTVFVLFVGPLLLAMAIVTVASAFAAIGAAIGSSIVFWVTAISALALPVAVIELLWLLQTGQVAQFVIGLVKLLGNQ